MNAHSINSFIEQLERSDNLSNAKHSLREIQGLGLSEESFATLLGQLRAPLLKLPERERILANLHRFLESSGSAAAWQQYFADQPDSLSMLLRLFSVSQYLSDLLINAPDLLQDARTVEGRPVDLDALRAEIELAAMATTDRRAAMKVLRDCRHRESLRIAIGDFIHKLPVDMVTEQLSYLAESIVHAAVQVAKRELGTRGQPPLQVDGSPFEFVVLALGKLGGRELNYSSDIDLVFIRDSQQTHAPWQNSASGESVVDEYFQRLGQYIIQYLGDSTPEGIAYRVDMRLRPHGRDGQLVVAFQDAVAYYDSLGRTWERQAFLKARSIAGEIALGEALIDELQPWVYRRYLMRADITGIAALKRRIEQRVLREGDGERNIKLGQGGIRDIEYVLQFLQLLHGPDNPSVRCAGTLDAAARLHAAGCITAEEQSMLESNYRYLRRVEHYLQIMFDRQTHVLPSDEKEFQQLACRVEGQAGGEEIDRDFSDAEQLRERVAKFERHLDTKKKQNRQILDHLLHDAFSSYGYESSNIDSPESDLILDPSPADEEIASTLGKFGFTDCMAAYRHLQELTSETIRFLSTRRSRHFLAAIAPRLLAAIATTPNPDATLISLAHVSASLGGKAVLWELFSINPPSMELCVRLCAASPYLAGILTSNPGMIDELMDSLMLDSLPTHTELSDGLAELCRNAVEIAPMLHSFKNSMHLRVGVRDILGKSTIAETHSALADIAEVCMEQVVHYEYHRLVHQLGVPVWEDAAGVKQNAELVVLAVGKLGGREPNYHSDLDVLFLFDGEGFTKSLVPTRRFEATTNRHFFNQLSQRVIQAVTHVGTTGRLYEIDVRLRPLGRSGELAITIDDLHRYFAQGGGQVWERQALCKARPIWGSPRARSDAMECILTVLSAEAWSPQAARLVYDHRLQLQHGAAAGNLKRGAGGTMDIEFIVQLLQLAHVKAKPGIIVPGTLAAIERLAAAQLLDASIAGELHHHYEFLRSIESGIRLMNLSARHEIPTSKTELEQLAFLLKSENRSALSGEELAQKCQEVRYRNREIFDATFARWLPTSADNGDWEVVE
jgi:glutamate-ammonia-ligase adenylyltransferase